MSPRRSSSVSFSASGLVICPLLIAFAHKADAASRLALRRKDGREKIDFPERDPLAEQLAEFARAVRGEGSPETGAEEGIAALRVIEEAL